MPLSINNHSRENSEKCCIEQENNVNSSIMKYITKNEKETIENVQETSLGQPNVLYSDGHIQPSEIGHSTRLRFGKITNPNEIHPMCTRFDTSFPEEFKDTSQETILRNGTTQFVHKPELMESQPDIFPPQVDNVRDRIQDMQHNIQNSLRFGVNTRLDKKPWKK